MLCFVLATCAAVACNDGDDDDAAALYSQEEVVKVVRSKTCLVLNPT